MFPAQHESLNALWAKLLLTQLNRSGIRHICLAPGSRNTPLTLCLAQNQDFVLHHHFDERGLGFFALGLSKSLRMQRAQDVVAIITTSGTAVANLLPAVIEATQNGQRLLVISADRPPRLQNCGANQTIIQPGLFTLYARAELNLPVPSLSYSPDKLLLQVKHGLDDINGPEGGVFHINMMFDEPLYPDGGSADFSDYLSELNWGFESALPDVDIDTSAIDINQWQSFSQGHGVIVVGALASVPCYQAVNRLANKLGWPVIADVQSQLRSHPGVISVDLILASDLGLQRLATCTHVLQIGGRLVSKRLQQFIDAHPWRAFWHVSPFSEPQVPGRNFDRFFSMPVEVFVRHCEQFDGPLQKPVSQNDLAGLMYCQEAVIDKFLQQQNGLDELTAVADAMALLPPASDVFIGNSMSIRLMDMLVTSLPDKTHVFANRGASGIDGLIATISGCRAAGDAMTPIVAVIGDMSALHDLNSLALLNTAGRPCVLIVLNNDGGGIFRFLPVPDKQIRQAHYQLPHGRNFGVAADMFGLAYHRPSERQAFRQIFQQAVQHPFTSVIEVLADADQTFAQVNALKSEVQCALQQLATEQEVI